MAQGFGISFLPDEQDDATREGEPRAQFQKAIQLLQLRLPRVYSGGAQIAPAPLLNAAGSLGMNPDAALIQQAMAEMAGVPMPNSAPRSRSVGPRQRLPQIRPTRGGAVRAPSRPTAPKIVPGITEGATLAPKGPVQKLGQEAPLAPPSPAQSPLSAAMGKKPSPWGGNTFF